MDAPLFRPRPGRLMNGRRGPRIGGVRNFSFDEGFGTNACKL
jgi:hypothetical protein